MPYLWLLLFVVMFALVLLAVSLGLRLLEAERKKRVAGMLQTVAGRIYAEEARILVREATGLSKLESALARWPVTANLDKFIRQAGLDWNPVQVVIVSALLAAVGALAGTQLRILMLPWLSSLGLALVLGGLPLFVISRRRARRLALFERQFPEALDFIARSLRAGHSLSASLDMLSAELPPPLGPEFRLVYEENNLGAPLEVALRRLVDRVPLMDVRFFVSAVLLQRQTGGNLAEILRNLARVIRERFQLKGHVRAMSAHGRVTAAILTVLPIVTMLGLMLLAPDYLRGMARDEHGRYLIAAAIIGQVTGYFLMRRIINIKI
ncbi:MAG: type II secretion system F family protein [Bryobacterales bacterium]|nr:type II secretion system F family protein [Bryobacteraceae bacterium]MDW8131011.1 type II secretion system F family protein [Bryobacterales bacterium]